MHDWCVAQANEARVFHDQVLIGGCDVHAAGCELHAFTRLGNVQLRSPLQYVGQLRVQASRIEMLNNQNGRRQVTRQSTK